MDRDIVFIDTCIFKAENYFCAGNRINSFEGLAKDGVISLITTDITKNEVISNLAKDASVANNLLNKDLKVLKNFHDCGFFVKKTKKDIYDDAKQMVEKHFRVTNTHIIGYDFCGDVEEIFKKYFHEERPFHEGEKKYEFPDAFVIDALENYCSRYHVKIIVLSNDKDFKKYKSYNLIIGTDFKNYLTSKLAEQKILNNIKNALSYASSDYCEDIEEKIDEVISNEYTYNGFVNSDNIDVTVEKIEVEIDSNDFSVTGKFNGLYQLEVNAYVEFKVNLHFLNLDYAYYDREDGEWYGGEWDDRKIEQNNGFALKVTYSKNGDLEMMEFDLGEATRIDKTFF